MTWEEKTLSPQVRKELILKQVSILDVLKYYGIDFEGETIPCPLPSHKDGVASFKIYRETNSFYCFGCQANSNVIDLVMAMEGCGFMEAIVKLMPMRREDNNLAEQEANFKDAYTFNMNCDARDFLNSLRKYNVYEDEKKRVAIIFKKMDKKLKVIDKSDEKSLKKMHRKLTEYIDQRRIELMRVLDGYNEERI